MINREGSPTQITECLRGVNFPCSKNKLISYARDHGCGDQLSVLQGLPDREFNSMADVMSGIGTVE